MVERDLIASYWEGFYAGVENPDTLYEKQFELEFESLSKFVLCFSKRQEPRTWFLGIYEGNQILPISDEQAKQEVRGTIEEIIRTYELASKKVILIDEPLVTSLSKDEFAELCKETAAIDTPDEKQNIDDENNDERFSIFDAKSNFKRWQFAVLVVGLSAFLTLALGRYIVWSNFFLLNGDYVRSQTAAWIYAAWGIPLVLFNALFTVERRNLFSMIVLSFAPLAIRQLSLLRNYSMVAMFICIGVVVAVMGITFALHRSRRRKKTLTAAIERMRNAGAMVLYILFTVCAIIDIFVPSISTKMIQSKPRDYVADTIIRYVSDEDLDTLNSAEWYKLNAEEQSVILLSIMQEMSDEMGVQTPTLFLEAEMIDNDAGYYDDSDNSIHIWKAYIEHCSAASATDLVLHELYHSFQNSILTSDALNWDSADIQTNAYFKKVWLWKKENEEYIAGDRWDVTFDAYYEQSVESDARDFAETFVPRFIRLNEEEGIE